MLLVSDMLIYKCEECSGQVYSSDRFCMHCGSKFDALKKEKLVSKSPKFQKLLKEIVFEYNKYAHGSNIVYQVVPYRAIYKKVTVDDYYIASEVTFKSILDPSDTYDSIKKKWEDLKKKGNYKTSPQSSSEYVIIGTKIYRYSDHWGRVASCNWDIDVEHEKWTIAVADIKDFKPIEGSDTTTYGGYVTLNPEYEKIVVPIMRKVEVDFKKLEQDYDLGVTAIKELDKYRDEFKRRLDRLKKLKHEKDIQV